MSNSRVQTGLNLDNEQKRKAQAARSRKWYEENRELALERSRRWQAENADHRREYLRKRYQERADVREQKRRWYWEHREARQAYLAQYRKDNAEKWREGNRKRRARKRGAAGTHTFAQFLDLCERYGWHCLRCGREDLPLTEDHIVPLVLGGSDGIENIQPLCGPCNSAKNTDSVDYRTEGS